MERNHLNKNSKKKCDIDDDSLLKVVWKFIYYQLKCCMEAFFKSHYQEEVLSILEKR